MKIEKRGNSLSKYDISLKDMVCFAWIIFVFEIRGVFNFWIMIMTKSCLPRCQILFKNLNKLVWNL